MDSKRFEMRFAGSGGQGVILASVILAEAAVIRGLHTVQSQAYGPEARGGVSKAGDFLMEPIRREYPQYVLFNDQPMPEIKLAVLGSRAGVIGAAMLS